jgi:integrase
MASLWKALEPSSATSSARQSRKPTAGNMPRCESGSASRLHDQDRAGSLQSLPRWHYGKDAPVIVAPAPSKPRERYLTKAERDKLLESIETPHVRLFVILALTTGARMGALLDLTWDRVDLERGLIDLNPAGRDITNKRRTVVPINSGRSALEEAQKAALTDHVIEYGGKPVASVKRAIAAAARRSGVPCSPHVFRHTAAVWMAEADVPMEKIAQYWATRQPAITFATYARFSPRFMADAAAALDW